jgi:hypothetical protein
MKTACRGTGISEQEAGPMSQIKGHEMRRLAGAVCFPRHANRVRPGIIRRAGKLDEFTTVPVILALHGLVQKKDNADLTQKPIASRNEHQPLFSECGANNPERRQQQLHQEERQGGFDLNVGYKTPICVREFGYPQ